MDSRLAGVHDARRSAAARLSATDDNHNDHDTDHEYADNDDADHIDVNGDDSIGAVRAGSSTEGSEEEAHTDAELQPDAARQLVNGIRAAALHGPVHRGDRCHDHHWPRDPHSRRDRGLRFPALAMGERLDVARRRSRVALRKRTQALTRRPDSHGTWIGFYGCSNRLIRVLWTADAPLRQQSTGRALGGHLAMNASRTRRPTTAWRVRCPACEITHKVSITWRTVGERFSDQEFQPDIKLPKESAA